MKKILPLLLLKLIGCSKPDGPFTTFHDNGQLKEEGTYKNGKPEGLFKSYVTYERLIREEFFNNRKRIKFNYN